jgi:carboxyl-terminal processing protease
MDSLNQEKRITPAYLLKKYFLFYIGIALLAGGFYGGYLYGTGQKALPISAQGSPNGGRVLNADKTTPDHISKDADFGLFWDVWRRVKEDYINKDTADTKLFYGAIGGIVDSLDDPYSVFLDPEKAKEFNESLSGSFDGIGAELGMKKNQLLIIATLPDMPAEKAGLRAGDKILSVDKKTTTNMTIDEAVTKIRGKRGTKVVLTIYRDGEQRERDIEIVRDKIVIQPVKWEMKEGGIGYIRIAHFTEGTAAKFKEAAQSLLAKKAKGLVLDVRNNPGGYLDAAVSVAGYWIDGKTVVVEKYADDTQDEYRGNVVPFLKQMPTVVLINKGSASASEIVSGALQDEGKAVLIGEQSFGKGSVQDVQRLSDGSELKLTIAKWLTPKGRTIQDEGIAPDIVVPMTDQDYTDKKDPQLDRALQELKNKVEPAP